MNNVTEADLEDLSNFEKMEESSDEDSRFFERSLKIIKESMGNVKQEILLTLPDETPHIVYVTGINISPKGECTVDFGTPSEERKAELAEHVEKCIIMQIQQALSEIKPKKWYQF
ncbi:head vertex assembly chaperone [Serratia phage X20]|uniref:Head vertex assembly chaperone n=3 Tax=Winklervirus TaxID=2560256 RepID=A0A1Z1LYW4_9CAUD|nr:head vertex assembly chaperone [Serratia phage CHI14]YP_010092183.1 head vertex assembly chaperone [Serratia phage X20]ARW57456.1 head vertex assembly chaperone [Serratia phage CHI14]ARW57731.1 head vertex assembly chaperone [Serratia phage CBH8]ARW58005.1 head vertex assembly chaperone [Serratia phage X20]